MSIAALLRPECRGALTALVDLVGAVGLAQVFWEGHSWSNKRIMPGYRHQYRSCSNVWQEVLRVTAQSFERFVQALCNQQQRRARRLRERLNLMQLEEYANLASLLSWWEDSCLAEQPAMIEEVQHMHHEPLSAEHNLMLALQARRHDKSPKV